MTPEENDLLCRVEGDAPMGQIMRRHWIAACLSEEVAEPDSLIKMIDEKVPGETIKLTILRDNKRQDVEVTLGKRPDQIEPE